MNDDSLQLIFIFDCIDVMIIFDAVFRVGQKIHLLREGAESVELKFLHRIEIKLESF